MTECMARSKCSFISPKFHEKHSHTRTNDQIWHYRQIECTHRRSNARVAPAFPYFCVFCFSARFVPASCVCSYGITLNGSSDSNFKRMCAVPRILCANKSMVCRLSQPTCTVVARASIRLTSGLYGLRRTVHAFVTGNRRRFSSLPYSTRHSSLMDRLQAKINQVAKSTDCHRHNHVICATACCSTICLSIIWPNFTPIASPNNRSNCLLRLLGAKITKNAMQFLRDE